MTKHAEIRAFTWHPEEKAITLARNGAPITLRRDELVDIALQAIEQLNDSAWLPEEVVAGLLKLVREKLRASPAEIHTAMASLEQELTKAGCSAFVMVGCSTTELVVYYRDDPSNEAVVQAFRNSLPAYYRGVHVLAVGMTPLEEVASSGGASFSSYNFWRVLVIRTLDAPTRHKENRT